MGLIFDSDSKPQTLLLKLWKRDTLLCIKHILGNPALSKHVHWQPEKIYTDESRSERIYNEAWTGDDWL